MKGRYVTRDRAFGTAESTFMGITPIARATTPVLLSAAPIRVEPVTSHNSTSSLAFSLQLFVDGFEYPLIVFFHLRGINNIIFGE
jgi:hypothetical protein